MTAEPATARRIPTWHDRAACREHDPAADWHTASPARSLRARIVCASCPVRFDCALDALERGEAHGIWGGLDVRDRRAVAAEYGYPPPSGTRHGTRSCYVAGCRQPPCRRAHATYEHNRRIGAT